MFTVLFGHLLVSFERTFALCFVRLCSYVDASSLLSGRCVWLGGVFRGIHDMFGVLYIIGSEAACDVR